MMDNRAVSDVVSYVLVFALIASTVSIVSVSGISGLQDSRDGERVENAQRGFDLLADDVEDIYQGGAPSRTTDIGLGGQQLYTDDNVTITVDVDDSGSFSEAVEKNVRPIVYSDSDDREIVYEAGAVFRSNTDGDIRVRDPPFIVSEDRIVLPIVGISSPSTQNVGGSTASVRTTQRNSNVAYSDTGGNVNAVRITVDGSAHTDQWETYLDSVGFDCTNPSTDGICTYDTSSTAPDVYVIEHEIGVDVST